MKRIAFLVVAIVTVAGVVASWAPASGHTDKEAVPIFGGPARLELRSL
jgi:hypothetical protein